MSGRWKFWVDSQPWTGQRRLFAVRSQPGGARELVHSIVAQPLEPAAIASAPLLEETREETMDALGDVTGFLQAALDEAWELGLRPTNHKDHTQELAAVRYHLEDMRTLAKLPERK